METNQNKQCKSCKEEKPLSAFNKKGNGLQTKCAPCYREYQRGRYHENRDTNVQRLRESYKKHKEKRRASDRYKKYGITQEEYTSMILEQKGTCKICKKIPDHGVSKSFHVDHCHATGKVRNLLCGRCNVGLGAFADSPELLIEAANYLKLHKGE